MDSVFLKSVFVSRNHHLKGGADETYPARLPPGGRALTISTDSDILIRMTPPPTDPKPRIKAYRFKQRGLFGDEGDEYPAEPPEDLPWLHWLPMTEIIPISPYLKPGKRRSGLDNKFSYRSGKVVRFPTFYRYPAETPLMLVDTPAKYRCTPAPGTVRT